MKMLKNCILGLLGFTLGCLCLIIAFFLYSYIFVERSNNQMEDLNNQIRIAIREDMAEILEDMNDANSFEPLHN